MIFTDTYFSIDFGFMLASVLSASQLEAPLYYHIYFNRRPHTTHTHPTHLKSLGSPDKTSNNEIKSSAHLSHTLAFRPRGRAKARQLDSPTPCQRRLKHFCNGGCASYSHFSSVNRTKHPQRDCCTIPRNAGSVNLRVEAEGWNRFSDKGEN